MNESMKSRIERLLDRTGTPYTKRLLIKRSEINEENWRIDYFVNGVEMRLLVSSYSGPVSPDMKRLEDIYFSKVEKTILDGMLESLS